MPKETQYNRTMSKQQPLFRTALSGPPFHSRLSCVYCLYPCLPPAHYLPVDLEQTLQILILKVKEKFVSDVFHATVLKAKFHQ